MPFPGTVDTLIFTVDPYDVGTAVTVTLTSEGGATLSPTATTTDGGHTWSATPTYTETGKWVALWTVTGTGNGVWPEEIWVSTLPSPAAAVSWRPELWQVADYIPGRTLVGAVDGYGNALNTFDNTTHPTGDQVQRLITAACAWVTLKTGLVDDSLTESARDVAALRAAGMAEQGYPDNRDDLNTSAALLAQATQMRDDLARANEAVTGQDPEDPEAHLLPVYSFPSTCGPVTWTDGSCAIW
jgi:hypothetical protein